MIFFGSWKRHLELVEIVNTETVTIQSQKIEVVVRTAKSPEKDILGFFNIEISNIDTAEINEIYCYLRVSKNFALFDQGMYLGSEEKVWKIDTLKPKEKYKKQFDLKGNRIHWKVELALNMSSFHSRFGHSEQKIIQEFELKVID